MNIHKFKYFYLIMIFVFAEPAKAYDCNFYRDSQQIGHLKAGDNLNLFSCLGYLHAQDRGFQMDYLRRVVQGRLAEILGPSKIKSDFGMRLMGLKSRADTLYDSLPASAQSILLAYTDGVNAIFSNKEPRGIEFKELSYHPDAWRPQDTMGLLLLKGLNQTMRSFESQLEEQEWLELFGAKAASLFDREGMPWDTSILKPQDDTSRDRYSQTSPSTLGPLQVATLDQPSYLHSLYDLSPIFKTTGDGSNNWILSPSRSRDGHAWLANDPHMDLKRPAFFYWVHLESNDINAIGASIPGLPIIVSGTNEHVSWGLTNANPITSELMFIPEAEAKDLPKFRPTIWFKTGFVKLPFFLKSFQRTGQGWPLLPLKSPKGTRMVLRWSGFDLKPEDVTGFFQLMKTRSASEMDKVFSSIKLPAWNFVFADTEGNIGYRVVGRVARYTEETPFAIPHHSLSEFGPLAFNDLLTVDEMPHAFNPSRGFLASANNRQWASSEKFFPGRAHDPSFRAFRIEERLQEIPTHDVESLRQIQCDAQAVDARFLVPQLLANVVGDAPSPGENKEYHELRSRLKKWNYQTTGECDVCGIYRRWMQRIYSNRHLNEVALYRLVRSSQLGVEWKSALLSELDGAFEDLKKSTSHSVYQHWDQWHINLFSAFGGPKFDSPQGIATVGDQHTINLGVNSFEDGQFIHYEGAVHRLIVEMSSPPKVYSILSGPNIWNGEKDLKKENSAWEKWSHCDLERRAFPLIWDQVQSEQIHF